jgi:hypothetical protein
VAQDVAGSIPARRPKLSVFKAYKLRLEIVLLVLLK